MFGDVASCDAWLQAQDHFADLLADDDSGLLVCSCYSDKTQNRCFGGTAHCPMQIEILNLSESARRTVVAKITVGYIPVLKRPSGKDSKQFGLATSKLLSACWSTVFEAFDEYTKARKPMSVQLQDKRFKCYPVVIQFKGDHVELQDLLGISTSSRARFPCRFCLVAHSDTDKFFFQCDQTDGCCTVRNRQQMLADIQSARQLLAAGSQHAHDKALAEKSYIGILASLWHLDMGTEHGAVSAAAQDFMHMVQGGAAKDLVTMVVDSLKGAAATEAGLTRRTAGILKAGVTPDSAMGMLTKRLRYYQVVSFLWLLATLLGDMIVLLNTPCAYCASCLTVHLIASSHDLNLYDLLHVKIMMYWYWSV